ncbi:zinc finger protein 276 [Spea bombifrons]|uniref:zinc finger protein 276 n=1 Tax=Spea bombifrons TaxID=233779 RepID=UPI002349572D|nr:zinc finger protein 276 [Spea bombifrons]
MKGERRGRRAAWQRRTGRSSEPLQDGAVLSTSRPQPNWSPEQRKLGKSRGCDGGVGRTSSAGYCRLCHGKFSSRSLRHAFGKVAVMGRSSEKQRRLDQVFFADFQQLVGVSVRHDPELPQFVCKDCHAQFYKCRSVLRTFIQRVNTSPTKPNSGGSEKMHSAVSSASDPCADLITSSPECLHALVSWTHNHAGNCQSVPSLQRVLSTQYCGIIRAVWGCGGGHDYIMETDLDCSALSTLRKEDVTILPSGNGAYSISAEPVNLPSGYSLPDVMDTTLSLPDMCGVGDFTPQSQSPALPLDAGAVTSCQVLDPPHAHAARKRSRSSNDIAKEKYSCQSEGDPQRKETRERQGDLLSSDDSCEPFPENSCSPNKKNQSRVTRSHPSEPRERKRPGPKPGWNKKIKREREELPTIYKCPHQGCTAVYRGADGMKKHVKEHHEEVRERPCPHPGCNKVFMIDRYLQRHVKLIHTEQRNYICDQCGQAFKQRKHLSVHQMRHSGAKPLQCEVCGFQCRQRASLKYHMTKHKAEADLEFACDQCGKRFEKAHNLNVHMSMVHPLTQSPAKPAETEPDAPSGTMDTELIQNLPP